MDFLCCGGGLELIVVRVGVVVQGVVFLRIGGLQCFAVVVWVGCPQRFVVAWVGCLVAKCIFGLFIGSNVYLVTLEVAELTFIIGGVGECGVSMVPCGLGFVVGLWCGCGCGSCCIDGLPSLFRLS